MSEQTPPNKTVGLLRFLPLLLLVAFATVLLLLAPRLRGVTVAEILAYTPDNVLLAAITLWGLYLLKSLSVFFPLMVLYVATGTLFTPLVALGVNLVGLGLCVCLPYFLGRWLGVKGAHSLFARYSKWEKLLAYSQKNHLFTAFFLRVINLLPGDIISLGLGALETPFSPYLWGSVLGLLPVMLPATLLGNSLANPLSSQFLIPCLLLSVGLWGLVLWLGKRQKKAQGL